MTVAFSKTNLDNSENRKPWSDWLPVTDSRFIIDRDNMRATPDIGSWGTHINMQIDRTAEGVAGQDISVFTFYCSSLTADYDRKLYNIEIPAYRKPGVAEVQYQNTVCLTDSSSST
ncbi:MAG: hypothetical protein ACM3NP_10310 [Actinomycetota bacterium]|jgi:hypothetical protein